MESEVAVVVGEVEAGHGERGGAAARTDLRNGGSCVVEEEVW